MTKISELKRQLEELRQLAKITANDINKLNDAISKSSAPGRGISSRGASDDLKEYNRLLNIQKTYLAEIQKLDEQISKGPRANRTRKADPIPVSVSPTISTGGSGKEPPSFRKIIGIPDPDDEDKIKRITQRLNELQQKIKELGIQGGADEEIRLLANEVGHLNTELDKLSTRKLNFDPNKEIEKRTEAIRRLQDEIRKIVSTGGDPTQITKLSGRIQDLNNEINEISTRAVSLNKLDQSFDNIGDSAQQAAQDVNRLNEELKETPIQTGNRIAEELKPGSPEYESSKSKLDYAAKYHGEDAIRRDEILTGISKKFPEPVSKNVNELANLYQGLGIKFDDITVKASNADGDFKKFHITMKNGKDVLENYSIYLGKVDDKLQLLNQQQYQKQVAPKFSGKTAEQALKGIRYEEVIKTARRTGFFEEGEDPNKLISKIRTQEPQGISFVDFKRTLDSGAVQQMQITVDRFGKTLVSTNKRLQDFFTAISKNTQEVLRWSVGATIIYSALFKLQDLVTTAIDNESKLVDVTIALGDTQRNINDIFSDAAKIAAQTGESINGVLEAYSLSYRAVGAIQDPIERTTASNKLLSDSLLLSKLSSLNQAEAIDVLAGSLRQMQKPTESTAEAFDKAGDLLDKWVAISQKANVDLGALAIGFSVVQESAENAGVSTEELNAIIASLAELIGGLGGKETGNAVRALIGGVYQDQAAEALYRYGISVKDTVGQMRPFLDISKEIYQLYKSEIISPDELNKIAYTLGGGVRRGQQYVAFLTDLERIEGLVAVQTNVQGTAQEALGRKLETVQTAVTRLSNSFQGLAQNLGSRGGVVDSTKGFIDLITALTDGISKLISVLGELTIPTALLGLGAAYFKGRGGPSGMGLAYQSFTGNLGFNALDMLQGARGTKRNPLSSRLLTDERILGLSTGISRNAAGFGLSALSALPALGEGNMAKAGATIGGGIVGTLVAKGNPIGGVIGSAIGNAIIDTLQYEGDINNLFKDAFVYAAEEGSKKQKEEPIEDRLFTAAGGGNLLLGKIRSQLGAAVYTATLEAYSLATGKINIEAGITPELAAIDIINQLDAMTPELQKELEGLFEKQPITFEIETSGIEKQRQDIAEQYETLINDIKEKARKTSLEDLFSRDIKPNRYKELGLEIQGLSANLTKLYTAFGDQFDNITNDINGSEQVFNEFSKAILEGSAEDIQNVNQLADEIFTLTAALEEMESKGGVGIFDFKGEELTLEQIKEKIIELQALAANLMLGLRTEQTIQSATIPQTVQLDIDKTYFPKVKAKAIELENIYKENLLPDERMKYEAELKIAETLFEMFTKGSALFYERVTGGPAANFYQAALDELTGSGEVPTAGKSIGFQTLDASNEQLNNILNTMYTPFLNQLQQFGYKEDAQTQIAILNDGIIRPITKDWKIVQYLLQQILDTEKKQLEGVYNLPEGASFFVPFQGYRMGFNNAEGGFDLNALNTALGGVGNDTQEGAYKGTREGVMEALTQIAMNPDMSFEERTKLLGREGGLIEARLAGLKSTDIDESIKEAKAKAQAQVVEQPISDISKTLDTKFTDFINKFGMELFPGRESELGLGREPEKVFGYEKIVQDILSLFRGSKLAGEPGGFGQGAETGKPSTTERSILELLNFLRGFLGPNLNGAGVGLGAFGKGIEDQQLKSLGGPERSLPKMETKLSLNISSTSQLVVDGRTLANIIKQYLYEDLIRFDNSSAVSTSVVI